MVVTSQVLIVIDTDLTALSDIDEVVNGHSGLAILVEPVGILVLQYVVEASASSCNAVLGSPQQIGGSRDVIVRVH